MQCKETGAGRSYQLITNTCIYFLNILFLNNKFVEGVTFFGLSEGGLLGQIGPPWRSMITTIVVWSVSETNIVVLLVTQYGNIVFVKQKLEW